jgi:glyceraldehyde-3-phosphate dehydrogenase (NAD(P))
MSREEIIVLLNSADRIRVRSGKAGFANTGQLQEYDRDIGRTRGDRPEVFVWEESIAIVDQDLFLAMDVSPDATPIPDIVDAIRFMAGSAETREESRRMTNEQLGLDGALC